MRGTDTMRAGRGVKSAIAGWPVTAISLNGLLALAPNRENSVVLNLHLTAFTGSLEAGMLLGQLLYWTPRATLEGGWIAKTDKEWRKELGGLSRYAVRHAVDSLVEMGVLEVVVKRFNGIPTKHYRLAADALLSKWEEYLSPNLFDLDPEIPESEDEQPDSPKTDNQESESRQSESLKTDIRESENGQSYNTETTPETTSETTSSPADAGSEAKVKKSKKAKSPDEYAPGYRLRLHFEKAWERRYNATYYWLAKDSNHAKMVLNACGGDLEKACKAVDSFLGDKTEFLTKKRHSFTLLLGNINTYLAEAPEQTGYEFTRRNLTDDDREYLTRMMTVQLQREQENERKIQAKREAK